MKYFNKKALKFVLSIASISVVSSTTYSVVSACNANNSSNYQSNSPTSSTFNSNLSKYARTNSYVGTNWNITSEDNVNRIHLSAIDDTNFSLMFPYEVNIDQIKTFLSKMYKSVFIGNYKKPSSDNFVVNDILANNREGWIEANISCRGYYDDKNTWVDGMMPYTKIRISNFKTARPTPTRILQKTSNGSIALYNDFPSNLYKDISSANSYTALINIMKNIVINFNEENFPTSSQLKLVSNSNSVSNELGILNLSFSMNGYFQDDEYCTYSNNDMVISGQINCYYKGLSSFSGNVINFLDEGVTSFGSLSTSDVVNKLVNGDSKFTKWLQEKIYNLIIFPANNSSPASISFSKNPDDYQVMSDSGLVVLSGSMNNVFVENQTISDNYKFGKDSMQIIISGLNKIVNTSVVKQQNYPIVDFSSGNNGFYPLLKPSEVKQKLIDSINVSWSNHENFAKKFFLVLNPPSDLENFKLKKINAVANDATGELRITELVFSNAYIDGSLADLVVCSSDMDQSILNNFVYTFPLILQNNTEISGFMYLPYELTQNLFPYQFDFNGNVSKLKSSIKEVLISNLPENFDINNDLEIKLSQDNAIDNQNGQLKMDVYVKKYIKNNNLVDASAGNINDWLKKTVIVSGFRSINPTYIERKLDYPKDLLPSDLEKYLTNKNDYEKFKIFFELHNLPPNQKDDIQSNISNFKISHVDNLNGTLDISFTLNNGYFAHDEFSTFKTDPLSITETFNLFNHSAPTKILMPIKIVGASQFTVSEFTQSIIDNTSEENNTIIKKSVYDSAVFLPSDVNASNFKNFIRVDNFKQIDDIGKTFVAKVRLKKFYDDNGILVESNSWSSSKTFYDVPFYGDFRDVINTRFKNGLSINVSTIFPEASNLSCRSWNEGDIKKFIVDNWQKLSMIIGDIPPIFDMQNDLLIKQIVYKENQGKIVLNLSLDTFYFDQQLIVNYPNGYRDETIITLTGFSSQEDTQIFNTSTSPVNATFDSFASDWVLNKSDDELKQLIIKNALDGSTKDILPSDISNLVINRIDDKLGMISVSFMVNKYWKDYTLQQVSDGNVPPLEGHNVWISGFKTRLQSSFSLNSSINLNQQSIIASNFFNDPNHDEVYWKQLFIDNNVVNINSLPSNIDFVNNLIYDKSNVVIDNLNGTITFNDVHYNQYFGQTFSVIRNNGSYDQAFQAKVTNQDDLAGYPYPTSIDTKPLVVISESPKISIVIKGFQQISSKTDLLNQSSLEFDNSSFLIQNGYSSSLVFVALNDVSNQNHDSFLNEFKRVVFKDCVIGTKLELDVNNLTIEPISYNSNDGTIVVNVKLNKYWDEKGALIDCVQDKTKQPLEREYTFSGFTPSVDTVISDNVRVDARNIGNFIEKSPSELKGLLTQDNSLYTSLIKQTIIENSILGNKNTPVNLTSNVILVDYVENDIDGTLEIKFSIGEIWKDGLVVSNTRNKYSITIFNLKKQRETSVLSPIDLNDWYNTENKTSRFDVRNIYAKDFLLSGYNGVDFDTTFRNLLKYNKIELVFNGVDNQDFNNISINSKIANDNDIEVTFVMVARYLNGNVFVEEEKKFTTKLIGFKKVVSGPTRLTRTNKVIINDPLSSWVVSNKIDAFTFYKIISDVSHKDYQMVYEWLQKLIFDNCVDKFSNIGQGKPNQITYKDVVVLTSVIDGSTPNIFDGTCPISFYLSSYYDENGNYVKNSNQNDASKNYLLKTVTLYPFHKIDSNNQATVPIAEGSVVEISSVKVGKDDIGNILEDSTLTTIKASDVLRSNYNDLFKAWVMQNLYFGNLNGILFNSIDDANNVELINTSFSNANDEEGYIIINARLHNYWEVDGFGRNGCNAVNIKITGFKKVAATKFNDTTHDLTSNVPSEPGFTDIIEEIKNSKPKEFISKVNSGEVPSNIFIDYVKKWIVINREEVFSFLPENMTDKELYNNIYIDVDENGFPIMQSDSSGEIKLSLGIKKYLNSDGNIVTPPSPPLSGQVIFSGFSTIGEPTRLAAESIVSIVELQANLPWFVAHDRDGRAYSTITVNSLVKNNEFIDNNEKNVIKRIILNKPDKNDGEHSNNYKILGGKLSYNVGSPENIIINKVVAFETLGIIDVYFSLGVAWTAEDDNEPTNKNMSAKLTLTGFKTVDPIIQISEKISPFIIGGVAGGVSLITILIVFLIFYKRRRDIEYQQ